MYNHDVSITLQNESFTIIEKVYDKDISISITFSIMQDPL